MFDRRKIENKEPVSEAPAIEPKKRTPTEAKILRFGSNKLVQDALLFFYCSNQDSGIREKLLVDLLVGYGYPNKDTALGLLKKMVEMGFLERKVGNRKNSPVCYFETEEGERFTRTLYPEQITALRKEFKDIIRASLKGN